MMMLMNNGSNSNYNNNIDGNGNIHNNLRHTGSWKVVNDNNNNNGDGNNNNSEYQAFVSRQMFNYCAFFVPFFSNIIDR